MFPFLVLLEAYFHPMLNKIGEVVLLKGSAAILLWYWQAVKVLEPFRYPHRKLQLHIFCESILQ